ncbi:low molecular weight protein arginine phosphatase, partial [bacterium]|nr:low molecular weight protein arginine phosphatase [bacterium]
ADLILVMEKKHRERVRELNPDAKNKTFLLKEFAGEKKNLEIRDPIGLSDEVYKEVAGEIKEALKKALPKILEYLGK